MQQNSGYCSLSRTSTENPGGNGRRNNSCPLDNWGPLHHCVESIDGISSVDDSPEGAVGVLDRVRPTDHISIASLLLALIIPSQGILHFVCVRVLGMRIVLCVNSVGDWNCSNSGSDYGALRISNAKDGHK